MQSLWLEVPKKGPTTSLVVQNKLPPCLPLMHESPVGQSCARHGVMQSGGKPQWVVACPSWELGAVSSPGNWSTARARSSSSCAGVEQCKDRMCTGALV